ncbi:MAG TPA: MarR family transcriptional regulator [Sphingomonadaceae bacterium]|nr:MarR family transcriptional regulator [Sphingomonadaceae bacterium]
MSKPDALGAEDRPLLVNSAQWLVPPPDSADDAAFARFIFIRRLLQTGRRWRNRLSTTLRDTPAVRSGGWQTLFWLSVVGRTATQRELAQRVGIEESTLARALDRLEKQGFVERAIDKDDRRAKRITLTAAAQPVIDRVNDAASTLRNEILRDVDPDDLATCLKVLSQIGDAFDALEGGETAGES